jgi:NADPH-dependent 2,4-dienoyl-CoA reductase/sulfur reductase-like enzyme
VLVVGAGLAGARTVAALRAEGFDGVVRVLGAEPVPPYDRPPLSKQLLTRPEPVWLSDDLGLDLTAAADEVHLGRPARALRVREHDVQVETDAGTLTAGHVVVATGARAVRPAGWASPTLHTLHTLDDAAGLRAALAGGGQLVVVGAGWVGAEVAGSAAAAGIDVTVVEAAAAPLAGAVGAQVGALTVPWHEAAGVRLVTGAAVRGVDEDGVRLSGGRRVPAAAVLAAVGVRPATGWLGGALPLGAAGALRVDPFGRVLADATAAAGAPLGPDPAVVPGVWAVGDVATRWSPRHGWVPGGHWDGALRGPTALARALVSASADGESAAGEPSSSPPQVPDPVPYVFSTQLGHDLALFGLPSPAHDVVVDRGHDDGWTARWISDGVLHAVLLVDRPRAVGAARRALSGPDLPRVERVVDQGVEQGVKDAAGQATAYSSSSSSTSSSGIGANAR